MKCLLLKTEHSDAHVIINLTLTIKYSFFQLLSSLEHNIPPCSLGICLMFLYSLFLVTIHSDFIFFIIPFNSY